MDQPVNRSHLIDYKYVLGLVLAGIVFYWTNRLNDTSRTAALEERTTITPDMRNRELDDVKSRLASLEAYLREHCGKG